MILSKSTGMQQKVPVERTEFHFFRKPNHHLFVFWIFESQAQSDHIFLRGAVMDKN